MASLFPQNKWKGPMRYDPWWRAEAWRYEHPAVGTKYLWRHALPGLSYATVAFSLYCAYDYFNPSDHHGHHTDAHGSSHSPAAGSKEAHASH